jgi:hypothetical protein
MTRKIVIAVFLLMVLTLAYFGLTDKKPASQDNLFAPNLMNRIPTSLPCPPFCDKQMNAVVSANDDTGLVITKRYKWAHRGTMPQEVLGTE